MISSILPGQSVIVLWSSANPPTNIEVIVNALKNQTGSEGKVQVEHVDIIQSCEFRFLLSLCLTTLRSLKWKRSYYDAKHTCGP